MMILFLVLSLLLTPAASAQVTCDEVLLAADLDMRSPEGDVRFKVLTSAHEEALLRLYSIDDVHEFFLGGQRSPEEAAEAHVRRSENKAIQRWLIFDTQWVIEYQGEFAGVIALAIMPIDWLCQEHQAQFSKADLDDFNLVLGYAILPEFRGIGLASRSIGMALDFAKAKLKARYVFASTRDTNVPSKGVLKKMGFSALGPNPKKPQQSRYYIKLN